MIVLDASVIVALLLGTDRGWSIAARMAEPTIGLEAPHLADVDVTRALRRHVMEGDLDSAAALVAIEHLHALEAACAQPLLDRVWALRANLTANDAVYVAPAEALEATLLTCDGRIARTPGMTGRVEFVR